MKILGIETSCDETAAAVVEDGTRVLSSVVSSQIDLHKKTGGIVPEVAARAHVENVVPVVHKALGISGSRDRMHAIPTRDDIGPGGPAIDAIAVTVGPGLISSLMIGVDTAKTLAFAWDKPLIAINHLEGHFYAARLETGHGFKYPVLALIVSGGHTMLVLSKREGHYQMLGQTLDDAAGEAFDKVAKLLDLGYPGGPIISKIALKGKRDAYDFPRPMLDDDSFDFSFSGIKTSVLYLLHGVPGKNYPVNNSPDSRIRAGVGRTTGRDLRIPAIKARDIAASFEQAVVDTLVGKTLKAADKYKPKTVILTGGVAADQLLRQTFAQKLGKGCLIPSPQNCTDNAVMVAAAGYSHACRKDFVAIDKIAVDPNLSLGRLSIRSARLPSRS